MIKNNETTIARIEVEQSFCEDCSVYIKKELQEIDDLNNVRLYPKESLITFNFTKAYKLSTALNMLSKIGYHERGERVFNNECGIACGC